MCQQLAARNNDEEEVISQASIWKPGIISLADISHLLSAVCQTCSQNKSSLLASTMKAQTNKTAHAPEDPKQMAAPNAFASERVARSVYKSSFFFTHMAAICRRQQFGMQSSSGAQFITCRVSGEVEQALRQLAN